MANLSIQEALNSISKGFSSLITGAIITESNSSPYTVLLSENTGFSVTNWNSSNIITFTLTFSDASTMAIPVGAGGSYHGAYDLAITTIAYAGTSADFTAELLKRSKI